MIVRSKLRREATQLRKVLGVKPVDAVNIFALAHRIENLSVVYYPMGKKLSGMCVKGQLGNSVIAVNSAMSLGRQRFTIAHEFYHLFFDENSFTVCVKSFDTKQENEIAADYFASHFLMPVTALTLFIKKMKGDVASNKFSLEDIIHIEQYFGVSHQVMVYRLRDMKCLDANDFDFFLRTPVRRKAEELGYSSSLYEPLPKKLQYMTFGNYIKQANKVFKYDLVSLGRYEELLLDAFRSDLVYGDVEEGDVID